MIFRQILHDDLGCASYLVGDGGVAAVIDPRLDADVYLELADFLGVRIEHVLETHNHADHASGHGRLAAATGATIHVHRLAAVEYEHEPFDDGWELKLGDVVVRALHTPGHRPEHTAFTLVDRARGPEPWAVLTGDSLLVGDVARPDLAVDASDGARAIFRSLRERLLALPDACEVWPGHVGGSLCGGAAIDYKVASTIGYERAHSPLLAIADEAEFVARTTGSLGAPPPNVATLVAFNRGPLQSGAGEPDELDPAALAAVAGVRDGESSATVAGRRDGESPATLPDVRDGESSVTVVDVRDDASFAAGHVPGAVNVPAGGAGFATRLAQLFAPDQPIALLGADVAAARRAARLAAAVGHRALAGVAGFDAWAAAGRACATLERLPADALPARVDAQPDLQLLDVRDAGEFAAGHIAGAVHAPWHQLTTLPAAIDPARPVAVVCRSGRRAATGASLLARAGAATVIHVADGGVPNWQRAGRPLVSEQ